MHTQNIIEQYIFQGNLDAAREAIKNGEPFSEQYLKNNFSQITAKIIDEKAIDLIDILIKAGFIETDIYELDSFDKSIFSSLSRNIKNDEASLSFFKEIMSKVDNINDEISDQTLLGYFIEKEAVPEVIKILIEDFGCNAQYKNNAQENLIHKIVNNYSLNAEKGKEYIKTLLENGVDINEKNVVGTTPLMYAVKRNKKEYIPTLLENGADPNEKDNQENSSFYYAVGEQFSIPMYELLAESSSADFNSINKDGRTLLTEFIRMMSDSENDLNSLQRLLSDGADLNHAALYYGNPKSGIDYISEKKSGILKSALESGAIDVNEQDNQGNTILHKVCAYNVNYDAEAAKEIYRKVKLLLENGADKEITNDKDETALTLASKDNLKVKTVELLMKA
ncbi:ankyrin repeat domain-containing protein [Flavobacterium sp. YJ01]|uniref:ankyrin repeat domain-containing protein n=1 Tax=unclassified Flavobacterium TaxID=196869 RepID=UPI0023E39254|nr:ankyrin repeat domain-containing protein [Flavobacterium sp. YJ01]WET00733.1 ankyrin repeat domain-containing protein [Flavobacterium sp. YJ01]